jgi:hypothetical protein
MKTLKLFTMVVIVLMMAVSTPLLGGLPQEQEVTYDLGEVDIICSSGTWGRCFQWKFIWVNSDSIIGEYTCIYTGYTKHYCHHLYVKIANFLYSGLIE